MSATEALTRLRSQAWPAPTTNSENLIPQNSELRHQRRFVIFKLRRHHYLVTDGLNRLVARKARLM